MVPRLRSLLAASALALPVLTAVPIPAAAYPVDCAILLCLAGGWPTSAPCAHAKAVFIQRITPWPIEPPLQLWNCPLGAAFVPPDGPAPQTETATRVIPVVATPPVSDAGSGLPELILAQLIGEAGLATIGDAVTVVRSLQVFHIRFSQRRDNDGQCNRSHAVDLGTYDASGAFAWDDAGLSDIPPAAAFEAPDSCSRYGYRAVFVDWRDHSGTYGFEEVRY